MDTQQEQLNIQLPVSFDEIVAEFLQYTRFSRVEVEHRVWMHALELGWIVIQDLKRLGVTPFQFDEKVIRFRLNGHG
jgi:hypothetical protein